MLLLLCLFDQCCLLHKYYNSVLIADETCGADDQVIMSSSGIGESCEVEYNK